MRAVPALESMTSRAAAAIAALAFVIPLATTGWAAAPVATYKTPPAEVLAILDAPAPPSVVPSPNGETMLLVDLETLPPIDLLARPFLRLGGVRVDPAISAKRREVRRTGIVIQALKAGEAPRRVALPAGARISVPVWSFDSKRFAFTRDLPDGVELWIGEAKSGEVRAIPNVRINDVLANPFRWTDEGGHLLVCAVPADRGAAPQATAVPASPRIEETAGKQSRMATFQDLLTDTYDESLFEYYGTSQLMRVDAETGATQAVGTPGLVADYDASPNDAFVAVTRLERPFSFRVPYELFTRRNELWTRDGVLAGTLAVLPVSDEVPQQGVPTGPRGVAWQPLQPATLVWVEALDGGDPRAKVEHRDRIRRLRVTDKTAGDDLASGADNIVSMKHRLRGFWWLGRRDQAWVGDYDRDRRWTTTWSMDFTKPGGAMRKIVDRSINDAYADPGNPVMQTRPDGSRVARQDGDHIYLSGRGATPEGDRPFLDRIDLRSLGKTRLFRSAADADEAFVAFVSSTRALITRESPTEPPNQHLLDLVGGKRTQLTSYQNPAPQLAGVQKRLIEYKRADGTPLSGFLYLPPGYQAGTPVPTILWAYPQEFSDASTAGQVRGSDRTFVRIAGISHLFFLTQGYAVLDGPAMPVIGDPETMNDTYVEQVVSAAKAAVDTLVAMGIADRNRVGIGGHSYGAFMTANLLAHSDLFAAGIARSGAYNRTLTPFGFQAERRSYWEATEIYTRISPFTYANQIDEPLLLIHGEEDNNSGTFPMQSERLFQALQGSGATARLVMLPFEGHGYRGRESVLHTVAEMLEWADRWIKNRPPRTGEQSSRTPR